MKTPERRVRVAGLTCDLHGDESLHRFAPSFGCHLPPGGTPPDGSLSIEASPNPAASPPWSHRGPGSHRFPDGTLAVVHHDLLACESHSPGTPPTMRLRIASTTPPGGDRLAHPAHYTLGAWIASPSRQLFHAGAVALGNRAALFVGIGGRGKTTSTLACARAGFAFLGDDLCAVEIPPDGTPLVHGIYRTAKLNEDSRRNLGAVDWPVLGVTPKAKSTVLLPADWPFAATVPLAAILCLSPTPGLPASPTRMPPSLALRCLTSTALPIASGSGTPAQWLKTAAALARQVPAFELGLTWDLDRLAASVHTLLDTTPTPTPTQP